MQTNEATSQKKEWTGWCRCEKSEPDEQHECNECGCKIAHVGAPKFYYTHHQRTYETQQASKSDSKLPENFMGVLIFAVHSFFLQVNSSSLILYLLPTDNYLLFT